jgi:hypothetical protein
MNEEYDKFDRTHDPDDMASRNIDVGGLLRRVKGTYADAELFLDSSNTDSELVISAKAYNATELMLSFNITAGSRTNQFLDSDGVTMRPGYLITCRVHLADGRHYDQSYIQEISPH